MKNTIIVPEKRNITNILENVTQEWKIVLINDAHNSFDYVIECLIKYCGHSSIQSEQCAQITHNNGVCEIKKGPYEVLDPIHKALLDAGLMAELD